MSVRSFQVLWAFFISAFFLSTPIWADSSGHLALPSYEPASGFVFQDAFPGIHFDDPVAIATPPGETNRLFVVERLGRIMVITNLAAPTKTLFMDLRNSITTTFFEDGLLGLAFHPNFASNGYFYVYRTYATSSAAAKYAFHDILARYSVSPDDPNKGLVSSEVRLIAQIDSQVYHNAGTIAFGPDGYLYLSIGDDGPAGEDTVPVFAQNIDKGLFGGIIRIDVDKKTSNLRPNSHHSSSTNYYIPRDNPFIGATNFNGIAVDPRKVRTEFYALGLRNPWRFTIHPTTGAIIAGDVGGATTEEVNEIVPGGNYGWPYFEGTAQSWPTPPGFTYRPPAIQYHHGRATNQGNCVIGGIFYFGNKLPGLYGKYIFGDFRTGNIWAAPYAPQTGLKSTLQRLTASTEIVAFAPDPRDNELLAVNTLNGRILRLNYIAPEEAPYFPQTLAETGAFADLKTLTPISDFIPYNVNVTFWSDNAIKKRWFSTPPQSSITFSEDGNWLFPNGMVWMKHFDMELEKGNPSSRKRLETRFIVKNDTGVYGVTYKWDPSGTNAVLVPEEGLNEVLTISEGGTNRSQTWRYPSRSECLLCHTELGGLAIGFTTPQLNCTIDYGNGSGLENQLQAFANSGYFKNLHSITNIQDIRKLSKADDETAPVYDRVRSFMAANCQFCHQPGSLNARWDARPDTTLDKTGLILPYYLVIPHSPASSEVVRRLTLRGTDQMPPLASNVQDATDLKLVTDWINGFPPAPWKSKDLSPIACEGSVHFDGQRIQVAGAGSSLSQVKDALQYAYFPSSNNFTATVKLTQQNSDLPAASAGILLRANDSSDAASALIALNPVGAPSFVTKTNQSSTTSFATDAQTASWVQLRKDGNKLSGWSSLDGTNWTQVGENSLQIDNQFFLGLFSSSGTDYRVNLAKFEQFRTLSVNLSLPLPGNSVGAQQPVYLSADVNGMNSRVARVEFWSDSEKLGEVTTSPYQFTWPHAVPGIHQMTARVIDVMGNQSTSPAVPLVVSPPATLVRYEGIDTQTIGNWTNHYGTSSFAIAGETTNIVSPFAFAISNATLQLSSVSANDMRVLMQNTPGGSFAWAGDSITLNLNSNDGGLYKISLYFVTWDHSNITNLLELRDTTTGQLLDSLTISNFGGGIYLSWTVRGGISIAISGQNGSNAQLAGLFLDPVLNAPPSVELLDAASSRSPLLPAPILLKAVASDSDGAISNVEFYVDDKKIGQATTAPYEVLWTGALNGSHTVFARAIDDLGTTTDSQKSIWTPRLPASAASWMQTDDQTQGDWIGKYGSEGYLIVNHLTNLPPSITFSSSQNNSTIWAYPGTSEKRALLTTNGTARIASTFYSQLPFNLSLSTRDGAPHKFSFYFLDWDRASWKFNLRVYTQAGVLLDERQISSFENGKYFSWIGQGSLRFEFTPLVSFAVMGGLFIDPAPSIEGDISLINPQLNSTFPLNTNVLLEASVTGMATSPQNVEFFVNGNAVSSSTQNPYYTRWVPGTTGTFELFARMHTANGGIKDSSPVQLSITNSSAVTAKAIFEKVDSITAGSWRNAYGTEGYSIFLDNTLISDPLRLVHSGDQSYVWAAFTDESRALQNSGSSSRSATVWYADDSFELLAGSSDGLWHRFSLYCLDWDYGWRQQKISIMDASTESLLDTQIVTNFYDGKYLTWKVRGSIIAKVESIAGEAVVSGIFYDPIPPIDQWRLDQFATLAPDQITDNADPDHDGIPNLLEYKLGSNPLENEVFPAFASAKNNGSIHLVIHVNPLASDVDVLFESSSDLKSWAPAATVDFYSLDPGQGQDTVDYRISEPKGIEFFRLKAVRK